MLTLVFRQFWLWVVKHPAVAWCWLLTMARLSRQDVSAVRAEFAAAGGEFTADYFDVSIPGWCSTFARNFNRDDPLRVLEVGSFEGRSTLFLLTYFPKAQIMCVNTWAGSIEEMEADISRDWRSTEERFDSNISAHAERVTKRKGLSTQVLPVLLAERQEFDLIYIDASHFADDVLIDGLHAWRMLAPGGVLIFDDLNWFRMPKLRYNPAWGISEFLAYHRPRLVSVTPWQLTVRKG